MRMGRIKRMRQMNDSEWRATQRGDGERQSKPAKRFKIKDLTN